MAKHKKRFQRSSISRYQQVERIYKNLFGDPNDGSRAEDLKDALRAYDSHKPGTERQALDVLRRLNDGDDPPFNTDDIGALRLLFIPPKPMSPAQRDKDLALRARQFWRALVFASIDQIENLWSAIHAFDTQGGDQTRDDLVLLLRELVPNSEWTDAQLNSLVEVAVHEVEFRDLAWWDAFHDFW